MRLPARTAALLLALAPGLAAQAPAAAPPPPRVVPVACHTTAGNFTLTVVPAWAPRGARRFLHLVALRYYDGNAFYRVVSGFVAQWGLNPDPRVTAQWLHRTIPDDPVRHANTAGTIAFADSGKNSRTTQVFINLGDNRRLDKLGFAPFGEVTAGMGNVRLLASNYGDAPPRGHGPDQAYIIKFGALYLTRYFPRLDVIYSCRVAAPPPAPARP